MAGAFADTLLNPIQRYRARWSARRIAPWVTAGDRVLDIGAGVCPVDAALQRRIRCTVVPADLPGTRRPSPPLQVFDGRTLPFADAAFDVGLLLFVLHHSDDPWLLLNEVKRVCRRIIAFEDRIVPGWDRIVFHTSHVVYQHLVGLRYPKHHWEPERWSAMAREVGLVERWSGMIGRQGGCFSPRHIMYVWERAPA